MVEIRKVDPIQAGKISACLYGAMSLLFVPFLLIGGLGAMMADQNALPGVVAMVFLAILIPALYGGMGFVVGLIVAFIYNLVTGWIGGLRVELR